MILIKTQGQPDSVAAVLDICQISLSGAYCIRPNDGISFVWGGCNTPQTKEIRYLAFIQVADSKFFKQFSGQIKPA
ncbi:MAG: hypothetical protein IPN60_19080 [Saprospiraceae bacterium]|nr:hypothetical protein [Candidatus Opimibacter skivensis]